MSFAAFFLIYYHFYCCAPRDEFFFYAVSFFFQETCRIRHEMFGPMPRLSDQDYDNIYATTGLDADNRMQYLACLCEQMELIIRAYAKFAKKVPGFSYLETHDQVTLIKCKRHFLCLWICRLNITGVTHIPFTFKFLDNRPNSSSVLNSLPRNPSGLPVVI